MASVALKARAKINLSIDVLRKRDDGYHEVKMIMQSIELHDMVFMEPQDDGIEVKCDCRWVPSDERNIAYKAAKLFIDEFNVKKGVKINIVKKIPVSAGLAGGSADASAVLKGMARMFFPSLSQEDLLRLGKKVGADVPFCITGGTMLAEGIGEKLTELKPLPETYILLIKPRMGISTAWVYNNLNLSEIKERPDMNALLEAIDKQDVVTLAAGMKNVLEPVAEKKCSDIRKARECLMRLGAAGSIMSGSGPTVFGVFTDKKRAEKAYESINNPSWQCYLTKTIG